MKKTLIILSLFLFSGFTFANLTAAQNNTQPTITAFTTPLKSVDRAALTNRTARIPVTWSSVNRPILANLIFEQILPDGSTINVELPRTIPWVNSNGEGIAAPILPAGNAPEIRLRVRLANMITGENYSTREIVLPMSNDGSGNSTSGKVPTISTFATSFSGALNPTELAAGNVLLPVNWSVIDRPATVTLVFEQVMPDGKLLNIELPRTTPWVNSSDKGMVAPKMPTGVNNPTEIRVRLRLIDVLFGRVFDQRDIVVPLTTPASSKPVITQFTTTATSVNADNVFNNVELVPVAWDVANRPQNTNLVFEQVYSDGSVRNAELPRDVLIVPSNGQGVVSLNGVTGTTQVIFRVRLVDLSNNNTLDSKRISLPIIGAENYNPILLSGDDCYKSPFPPSAGLAINKQGKVLNNYNGAGVGVDANTWPTMGYLGSLGTNETFNVLEGPFCVIISPQQNYHARQWRIKANNFNLEGWVSEYSLPFDNTFVRFIAPADAAPPADVQIATFTATPDKLTFGGTVTVNWDVKNALRMSLFIGNKSYENPGANGSLTLNVKDVMYGNPLQISVYAVDAQGNSATQEIMLPIDSAVVIKSFMVNTAEIKAGDTVTFSWDIQGSFQTASVTWIPGVTYAPGFNVTTNTGTAAFQIPEYVNGSKEFILNVVDSQGVLVTATTTANITCANTSFFVNDPSILPGKCAFSAPQTFDAAYQTFEHGFMVWHKYIDVRYVSVFYNDGNFMNYSDWDGSTYVIEGEAPAGLIKPERGFGYVWIMNPNVRENLGWATSSEQGYSATAQSTRSFGKYDSTYSYVTLPNGHILRLQLGVSGYKWAYLN